jgi:hypothetical protein
LLSCEFLLVTIELTRQKDSIDSASASGQYYRTLGQAEREFRILSVKEQSKVDRLTGMCNTFFVVVVSFFNLSIFAL